MSLEELTKAVVVTKSASAMSAVVSSPQGLGGAGANAIEESICSAANSARGRPSDAAAVALAPIATGRTFVPSVQALRKMQHG